MAVTGSKVIKTAGKYLGKGGSFVWKYYGLSTGTAWCAAFVSYVMNKAGAKSLFYDGKPVFYVPYAQQWLKKHCKHVKMADAEAGDIVIFTWDGNGYNSERGSRDHIGFIRKKGTSSTVYTREGNTLGSKVADRTRPAKYIYGIYRPKYGSSKTTSKTQNEKISGSKKVKNKIYLSPSNHGVNQNKCRKSKCYEDKHTRPMAEACAKYLRQSGFEVKIAGKKTGVLNGARTKEADSWGADLYVPIHTNASDDKSVRYLMFMCYDTTGKYKKLYDKVAPSVKAVYPGGVTKFVTRKDLYEIKNPKAMTLYCEMGFHTNKKDCDEFIHKPDMVGKALAKGICNYFGKTFTDTTSKYKVQITADVLNVRAGAGVNTKVVGKVKKGGVYTIVKTSGNWGKLKSGLGWIYLKNTKKVG